MNGRALLFAISLTAGCGLTYDFEDIENLPCSAAGACAAGFSCIYEGTGTGICVVANSRQEGDTCSDNPQCFGDLVCDNALCDVTDTQCIRQCRAPCDAADVANCADPSQLCFAARNPGAAGSGFCQAGECTSNTDCREAESCIMYAGVTLGLCTEACSPVTSSSCPAGEGCYPQAGDPTQTACSAAGTVPTGGDCSSDNCAPGNICLVVQGSGAVCLKACDPNGIAGSPCAGPTPTCVVPVSGMNYGVCSSACLPTEPQSCGNGFSCQPLNPIAWQLGACAAAGAAQDGELCAGGHIDCASGLLCSWTSGTCRPVCNGTVPCVQGMACKGINAQATFGICEAP
jgi:hypothetical protein